MDDFESMWKEEEGVDSSINNESSHEYQIVDGVAYYKIMADVFSHYYHAKHGESMVGSDRFESVNEKNISFRLK
jgi:hypothetical protein